MAVIIFFALILSFGIWSAGDTGPHHPTYVNDTSWHEKELHAKNQPWERDHE